MPRCKNCGSKFEAFRFLQKYCGNTLECKTAEAMYNLDQIKKKEKTDWTKKKQEMRPVVYSKEYKSELQRLINKLSKMIDEKFEITTCIDCNRHFGKQKDAGHFHSVGEHSNIRWNLHNIHTQRSECNRNGLGGGRKFDYHQGLIKRYGQEYADLVHIELNKKYPYIGLNSIEVAEKIKIVRNLIKHFDTFHFESSISARDTLNNLIGIYK